METPRNRMTRRDMLKWLGLGATATVLAACAPQAAPTAAPAEATSAPAEATKAPEATAEVAPTETPIPPVPTDTPPPTAAPRIFGKGTTEIVCWYQDWDGSNKAMAVLGPKFIETHPDVTLNLQAIGYGDLFAKMLPAIAAGTEGDVLMAYTNWVVSTDVKQVFLDLTEAVGGAAEIGKDMWPAAFQALDVPADKVYYIPWAAGIRGGALTVNKDHLAEQSIDYMKFGSFEEVIDAGVKLTKKDAAGKLTQAGLSPRSVGLCWMFAWVWQLGGTMFDRETGKWSWNSPEGEAAAQIQYDLYWKQGTCDYELFTNEYQAVSQKLVSIWADGAWTAGSQTDAAGVPADNIVCPFLADAKEKVLYPDHMGIWALSRKLAKTQDKIKPCLEWAMALSGPDGMMDLFNIYSGVGMSKTLYTDPRIEKAKYGLMSKRVAEGMWPYARYSKDHVADLGPAATELDRAMRKEISIKEALANMDTYCQEQEDAARERIGI